MAPLARTVAMGATVTPASSTRAASSAIAARYRRPAVVAHRSARGKAVAAAPSVSAVAPAVTGWRPRTSRIAVVCRVRVEAARTAARAARATVDPAPTARGATTAAMAVV